MSLNTCNTYIVYKHTSPNNKVYIGITKKKPNDRWASGFGYEHQIYFFRAIVKYGWDNFKHEILYTNLTEKEAKAIEIRLIKEYNSTDINCGYNIDLGGDLHKVSEETRNKISEVKRNKKWTERQRLASLEYYARVGRKKVNKYDSEGELIEVFDNYEEAAKDANITPKTMQYYISKKSFPSSWKFIYSYDGYVPSKKDMYKAPYNAAPVDMFDLSLNYIRTFPSISAANRFLGVKQSHIERVCRGKGLTCRGYIWRYHNENKNN